MNNIQEVIDLVQMIFDTIKKYLLLVLGRGDEVNTDKTED